LNLNNSILNLPANNRILIIHHWDFDGMCSAALLIKYLNAVNKGIKIFTEAGNIGKYYISQEQIDNFKSLSPTCIIVCDYAIPKEDIISLKEISNNIYIFDHHRQEEIRQAVHINPFTDRNIDGLKYPSAGWVINDYLGRSQEILAVLGAIGDQEDNVRQNSTVRGVLKENNLSFEEAREIAANIDSCYIINDYKQIRHLVKLLSGRIVVRDLLFDRKLLDNREKIDSVINTIVENKPKKDDGNKVLYARFKSDFQIISDVTRKLSRKFPEYLVVVINDSNKEEANIYFRNKKGLNLIPVIELAKRMGYNSGGKKEVAGVILPPRDVAGFLIEALDILGILFINIILL
jgi:oligoribonuclease NrnB/cAMP/cGMP phosphodiesterase (DHH superfamily)